MPTQQQGWDATSWKGQLQVFGRNELVRPERKAKDVFYDEAWVAGRRLT